MKWIAAILFITLLVISPAMAVEWVTNPINGHTYTLVFNNSSWQDAEDKAIALSGHLVTIRSQTEQDWVFNYALNATSAVNPTVYGTWIGMYQLPGSVEPAGGWVWSSGEPVFYTHWQNSTGEPNDYYGNSSENWAKMYVRQHDWDEIPSFWNDTLFYEPVRPDTVGIVEVVPEPSSLLTLGGLLAPMGIGIIRKRPRRYGRNISQNASSAFISGSRTISSGLFLLKRVYLNHSTPTSGVVVGVVRRFLD